ncbi:class I tRNA ligase family protein [Kocuria rhizophila]|nr:class I tRNA ligase family protein [Kocuria rhizophila]
MPEDQLPCGCPRTCAVSSWRPRGRARSWRRRTGGYGCPACDGAAKRDTDTMDTFVDSSWYYLRYTSRTTTSRRSDRAAVDRWLPVDQYVAAWSTRSCTCRTRRFFTKALYDFGLVGFTEPFKALLNQGQVLNGGKAMSKSLGNGVDLGEQLDAFGVDAVRLTMVFASPPEDDVDWAARLRRAPSSSWPGRGAWRRTARWTRRCCSRQWTRRCAAPRTARSRTLSSCRTRELQRGDRPHDGAGEHGAQGHRHRLRPGGSRRARGRGGRRDPAEPRGAVHRRGHVAPDRPRGYRARPATVDPALPAQDTVTAVVQIKARSATACRSPRTSPRRTWRPRPWHRNTVQRLLADALTVRR